MKKTIITTSILALFAGSLYAAEIEAISGQSLTFDSITKTYTSETPYADQKYMAYKGGSIIVNGDINATFSDFNRSTSGSDVVAGLIKVNNTKIANGDTTDYSGQLPSIVVNGTVRSTISGNSNIYAFYGGNGGNVANATSTVGAVEINVQSGTVSNITIGGGKSNDVLGNATLNITGGNVNEILGASGGCSVGGTISINVSGGTVDTIYAGGQGTKSIIGNGTRIVVSGSAQVNNIYGGSWLPSTYGPEYSTGTIKNGTSITLKDSVNVSGEINGGCVGYKTQIENIEGDKVLNIESYNGTLGATIVNMDVVNISADSKVEFTNAFDVDTLVVEIPQIMLFSTDAQVKLEEGTTFDILTIVGDFAEIENSVSLDSIFGDSASVVLSSLKDDTTALTVVDANGQEWTTENLTFDDNGNVSFNLGVAVPEPSTYTMIFGAVALGFVAYRRRK